MKGMFVSLTLHVGKYEETYFRKLMSSTLLLKKKRQVKKY